MTCIHGFAPAEGVSTRFTLSPGVTLLAVEPGLPQGVRGLSSHRKSAQVKQR